MLNATEQIILNGRFPSVSSTHTPYTFFRPPNSHCILDYNLIGKHHVSLVQSCDTLPTTLPPADTDHFPIHLHLLLNTSPAPVPDAPSQKIPPRTLFHSKKLKDPNTKDTFTKSLSKKVAKSAPKIAELHSQFNNNKISPQTFVNMGHSELTSILIIA